MAAIRQERLDSFFSVRSPTRRWGCARRRRTPSARDRGYCGHGPGTDGNGGDRWGLIVGDGTRDRAHAGRRGLPRGAVRPPRRAAERGGGGDHGRDGHRGAGGARRCDQSGRAGRGRRSGARAIRAPGHRGQQRRRPAGGQLRGVRRRRLPAGLRADAALRAAPDPAGAAGAAGERPRPDREPDLLGRQGAERRPVAVKRLSPRRDRVGQDDLARRGPARHHRQLDRPGLHRHRPARAAVRERARSGRRAATRRGPDPRRPFRRPRRDRRHSGLPLLDRRGLHHRDDDCWWTAAWPRACSADGERQARLGAAGEAVAARPRAVRPGQRAATS